MRKTGYRVLWTVAIALLCLQPFLTAQDPAPPSIIVTTTWDINRATGGDDPDAAVRAAAAQNPSVLRIQQVPNGSGGLKDLAWFAIHEGAVRTDKTVGPELGMIDPATNELTRWDVLDGANFQGSGQPFGLVVDALGSPWMSLKGQAFLVQKVPGSSNDVISYATGPSGTGTNSYSAHGVAIRPNGTGLPLSVLVAVPNKGRIVEVTPVDPGDPAFIGFCDSAIPWSAQEWDLREPDPDDPDDALFNPGPYNVAVDPLDPNTSWFTEHTANRIARMDLTFGTVTEWQLPAGLIGPVDVKPIRVPDPSNPLLDRVVVWFTVEGTWNPPSSASGAIGRLEPAPDNTATLTIFRRSLSNPEQLFLPQLISIANDSELWFAEQGHNAVTLFRDSADVVETVTVLNPLPQREATLRPPEHGVYVRRCTVESQVVPMVAPPALVQSNQSVPGSFDNGFAHFKFPPDEPEGEPQPGPPAPISIEVVPGTPFKIYAAEFFKPPTGGQAGERNRGKIVLATLESSGPPRFQFPCPGDITDVDAVPGAPGAPVVLVGPDQSQISGGVGPYTISFRAHFATGSVSVPPGPPGVMFPVGLTSVTMDIADSAGTIDSSCSFKVFVCPADLLVQATSPTGATVALPVIDVPGGTGPDSDYEVIFSTPAGGPLPAEFAEFPFGTTVVNLTVQKRDNPGESFVCSFSVTVNRSPVANDDATTTLRDTPVTIDVLANDSDPDGDALEITAVAIAPGQGSVVINDNPAGVPDTVTYTPPTGFTGTATFTYTIDDGKGGTDTAIVTVEVTRPPNSAPVAMPDTATTTPGTPVTITVLANDSDPDGDHLEVTSATVDNPAHGVAVVNDNPGTTPDTVTYTPAPGFTGTATLTYTIDDGNGGTASSTITVTVRRRIVVIWHLPCLWPPHHKLIPAFVFKIDPPDGTPVNVEVLSDEPVNGLGDGDEAPDAQVVRLFGAYTVLLRAERAGNRDGRVYTIKVTAGSGPTETFQVGVPLSLGHRTNDRPLCGAVDSGPPYYDANNRPPDARSDSATTSKNTAVTIPVLANDSDLDGDTLTVSNVSNPPHGTATPNPNGTITYAPDTGFVGTDSFTYTVSDGRGGTDTAKVVVTVKQPNRPPDARDDTAATGKNTAVTIAVLVNDSDPDGDTLTVSNVSNPPHGTATPNPNGTITYAPDTGFVGTDSFTYAVSDGRGGTDTAKVVVTVKQANRPPDARNDTAKTHKNAAVTIKVLSNDTDPDGDPLKVTGVTQPANGKTVKNANGTITYTPKPGFAGTDSFTYSISDERGGTDTATVTVAVARFHGHDDDEDDHDDDDDCDWDSDRDRDWHKRGHRDWDRERDKKWHDHKHGD